MSRDASPTPDDETDSGLLAAIARGVEVAFVELYRRREHDVYRFAFTMAKSRSFAQDVTQEVFLNVLENAARFDAAKGTARAWLFGCARHVILDRFRLERRWVDDPAEEPSADDSDERVLALQRSERLHAAIAELPVEYREALVLCQLEELSYAESAAVLACPLGTVRSRLHRARALLAAMLLEPEPAPPPPAEAAKSSAAGPLSASPLKTSEACS
jgi:RNA polymerase sigma-70 factor (ECF subfamily)